MNSVLASQADTDSLTSSNNIVASGGDSSSDSSTSKSRFENNLNYAIDLLSDYKGNLQIEEERGLYGNSHQLFEDYEDIISLIDSKISFFQNLQQQVRSLSDENDIGVLLGYAKEEWMEVYLIEKYAYLRLQPARAILGTKCSVNEILESNIPYLSEHFNLYPLWIEFKQRALNDQNIYESTKQGFVQSWLDSAQEWEEIWFNPPQGYCDNNQNQTNNTKILSVGAIKLYYQDFSLDNLQTKINSLITLHPDTDILVTPEYIYFGGGFAGRQYSDDPVIIDCENGLCSVNSIGTTKSDEIKIAIESLQQIASNNEVNIIFGTVAERIVYYGYNFTVNTQVIINKDGNIIGKHSKYDIAYSSEVSCEENPIICEQVRNLNLNTAIVFELEDKEGNGFEILPSICGEKLEPLFIEKVANNNAYLTIGSDFGGDPDYENITLDIQNGIDPFAVSDRGGLKFIRDAWVNNNVINSNSYLLVADAWQTGQNNPTAGIISWDLTTKIEDLDISEDYIYGKINIGVEE